MVSGMCCVTVEGQELAKEVVVVDICPQLCDPRSCMPIVSEQSGKQSDY